MLLACIGFLCRHKWMKTNLSNHETPGIIPLRYYNLACYLFKQTSFISVCLSQILDLVLFETIVHVLLFYATTFKSKENRKKNVNSSCVFMVLVYFVCLWTLSICPQWPLLMPCSCRQDGSGYDRQGHPENGTGPVEEGSQHTQDSGEQL